MRVFPKSPAFRAISYFLAVIILATSPSLAYTAPNALMSLTGKYDPPLLKGIKVDSNNPLRFEFIFDEGAQYLTHSQLETESKKLIGYFLCALAIPEDKLWVNLSPNEPGRIIPKFLGNTGMGEAMLEDDYLLKQLSASLTYPETKAGKRYWDNIGGVGATPRGRPGQVQGPAPTNLSKVWIMPDSAEIYCDNNKAFITKSRLKALSRSQAFKTDILSMIEQEVNQGKTFIRLRQMYNALLLAVWFKKHLKENILNHAYANKQKIAGIEAGDTNAAENVYQKYMTAFKAGAYDYTKSEKTYNKINKHRYFCGGVAFGQDIKKVEDKAERPLDTLASNPTVTTATVDLSSATSAPSIFGKKTTNTTTAQTTPSTRKDKKAYKEELKTKIEALGVTLVDYKHANVQQLQDTLVFLSQVKPQYRQGIRLMLASRYFHPLAYLFHNGIAGQAWHSGKALVFLSSNRQNFLHTLVHEITHVMTFKNKEALDKITSYAWDDEDFDPTRPWSFFTAYATADPLEDAAEAGAVAVLNPQAARGNKVWESKIKTVQNEFFLPNSDIVFNSLRNRAGPLITAKRAAALSTGAHGLIALALISPAIALLAVKSLIALPLIGVIIYSSSKITVGLMRLFSGKGNKVTPNSWRSKLNKKAFTMLHTFAYAAAHRQIKPGKMTITKAILTKILVTGTILACIGIFFLQDKSTIRRDWQELKAGKLPQASLIHKIRPKPMPAPAAQPIVVDLRNDNGTSEKERTEQKEKEQIKIVSDLLQSLAAQRIHPHAVEGDINDAYAKFRGLRAQGQIIVPALKKIAADGSIDKNARAWAIYMLGQNTDLANQENTIAFLNKIVESKNKKLHQDYIHKSTAIEAIKILHLKNNTFKIVDSVNAYVTGYSKGLRGSEPFEDLARSGVHSATPALINIALDQSVAYYGRLMVMEFLSELADMDNRGFQESSLRKTLLFLIDVAKDGLHADPRSSQAYAIRTAKMALARLQERFPGEISKQYLATLDNRAVDTTKKINTPSSKTIGNTGKDWQPERVLEHPSSHDPSAIDKEWLEYIHTPQMIDTLASKPTGNTGKGWLGRLLDEIKTPPTLLLPVTEDPEHNVIFLRDGSGQKQRRKFSREKKSQAWRRRRDMRNKEKNKNSVGGINWQMGNVDYNQLSPTIDTTSTTKPQPTIKDFNGISINILYFKRKVQLRSSLT